MLDNEVPKVFVTIIHLNKTADLIVFLEIDLLYLKLLITIVSYLSFACNFLDTFEMRIVNMNKDSVQTRKYPFNPEFEPISFIAMNLMNGRHLMSNHHI